jgi:hypothetical protein
MALGLSPVAPDTLPTLKGRFVSIVTSRIQRSVRGFKANEYRNEQYSWPRASGKGKAVRLIHNILPGGESDIQPDSLGISALRTVAPIHIAKYCIGFWKWANQSWSRHSPGSSGGTECRSSGPTPGERILVRKMAQNRRNSVPERLRMLEKPNLISENCYPTIHGQRTRRPSPVASKI